MAVRLVDLAAGVLAVMAALLLKHIHSKRAAPLPPGPIRWPLIGGLLSMPEHDKILDGYNRWAKQYGTMVYTEVLNQKIVVISSHEIASELLDRRASIYSQRPRFVMAGELVGLNGGIALSPFGPFHRRGRKYMGSGTTPKGMETLRPAQEDAVKSLLQRLVETPEDFRQHIWQTSGAALLKLIYGYDITGPLDKFLTLGEHAMDIFSIATVRGAFLVDTFPWLKHVPWAPFKSKARAWNKVVADFRDLPAAYTENQMEANEARSCILTKWLEDPSGGDTKDKMLIRWSAAALWGGSIDTVPATLSTFFLLIVLHPHVRIKAQAEIDRVIGNDRLPTYSDRESLPYIEAVYKELIRWHPAAPLGFAHRLEDDVDDIYNGMLIPRGSVIVPNIYAMTRNPEVYSDPDRFEPERFMAKNGGVEMDPKKIVFGFGRRRCPGAHIAHSSVWLTISLLLAAYDITPHIGASGEPELPGLVFSQSTISQPEPFKCTIKPRSEKAKQLIQDSNMSV